MDIIKVFSDKIISRQLSRGRMRIADFKSNVTEHLWDISDKRDKVRLLTILVDEVKKDYEEHKLVCERPNSCNQNEFYELALYYLRNELIDLDIILDENTFTEEDKKSAESKLDQILKEIEFLKKGQELIYEDLLAEIEELKELYFLGKKNWSQLLMGKVVEMTVSGVIGGTVSQNIIDIAKEQLPKLI
ncbi:hypothetical protein HMPREF9711_02084 [Myroides odoratimimus CCUG 3837]|uniref:hypothetical protein n=1 Tax=Myroides odoratimimus TaxID=76832 RepID=UPI000280A31B|nr:hypothetical protein [Myroides odoratimimus]EKB03899.1 hypothetical protein HMPREF9711_02084 [Myroides odoratimimus CCUG 3837]